MIKLIGTQIAVQPVEDSDYSPSGLLIIPDMAKDRADQGIVKYVGPKVKNVSIGDYVLFSGYTGTLLIIEGEGKLIIFPEDFVVARYVEDINIDIAGLYMKGVDGEYFPAPYNYVIQFTVQSIKEQNKTLPVKSEKLKREDYDKLRGGVGQ